MEDEKFQVKVVGIIFDPSKRKVLLTKRDGGACCFVEGTLGYGEELDERLKNLVQEKTGFSVHNLGAVYAENMLEEKDVLKLYFLCEAMENRAEGNFPEVVWVHPAEVEAKLSLTLPTRLREYLDGLE